MKGPEHARRCRICGEARREHRPGGACASCPYDPRPDGEDLRPCVYVACDFNPDGVRTFYEVPEELAQHVWRKTPFVNGRTFAQALADLAVPKLVSSREGEDGER